jgi:hypothetical protein
MMQMADGMECSHFLSVARYICLLRTVSGVTFIRTRCGTDGRKEQERLILWLQGSGSAGDEQKQPLLNSVIVSNGHSPSAPNGHHQQQIDLQSMQQQYQQSQQQQQQQQPQSSPAQALLGYQAHDSAQQQQDYTRL